MPDLIKNKNAVSQVVGFILSLSVTSAVVVSAGFLTTSYIDANTKQAAQTEAENIAVQVINLLVNAYLVKQKYPDASYSTSIDIPLKLVDHYSYYISVNSNGVQVNSYDNSIQVTKSYLDVSEIAQMDVNGWMDGAVGEITVSCEPTNYAYKYDFGPADSDLVPGFELIMKDDPEFTSGSPLSGFTPGEPEELCKDFIFENDGTPTTFTISGLTPGKPYSLTFSVGDKDAYTDPNHLVDNMLITVDGFDINGNPYQDSIEISCSEEVPYNKGYISDIYPDGSNSLVVTFDDNGGANTDYWAIGGLTVEQSKRQITITGGS